MFPIHGYHCHSCSAGAQADVLCLYLTVFEANLGTNPDVSFVQLLIEKGELYGYTLYDY